MEGISSLFRSDSRWLHSSKGQKYSPENLDVVLNVNLPFTNSCSYNSYGY